MYGVDVTFEEIRDWHVASGQWFGQADIRASRKVCLLGATVATELFPDQDPIGQQIILRDVPFDVIGVLETKGQTAGGDDQDDCVIAPYTTVQKRLAGRQFIAQILGSAWSPDDVPAAMEEASAIMRESHGLADWEEADFTVRNQSDLADAATGTTEVMTLLLAAIAGISLLVGGIGIMNIMLVSLPVPPPPPPRHPPSGRSRPRGPPSRRAKALPVPCPQSHYRSKRSSSMTLVQAATKSRTNFYWESAQA